jgi:hypothetical protein
VADLAVLPLTLPGGWEVLDDDSGQTTLVAREPADAARPAAFRANIVLTAVPLGGLGFPDWQAGTDEVLQRVLVDYLVVDLEKLTFAGRPAGRRLAHHASPAGEALTMEQWFIAGDDLGHTLTATVETWRYDELADLCAQAARSWRPVDEA